MTSAALPLDVMCPMHVVLSPDGRIVHAGPTLRKLRPSCDVLGRGFLSVFAITRPQGIVDPGQLAGLSGSTLHLKYRDAPQTALKGVIVPRPDGAPGMVVNLSFGISIVDAVQTYALNGSDFAPTDLTVEMLYLVEAKSAVMAASRKLNERLQEARTIAEQQAVTDALTGLENRRGFERFLTKLIARQTGFAVMHVDLDHFKQVNDTLGHDVGDRVLQQAAAIMTHEVRDRDLVARVGGDEFIMVIDGAPGLDVIGRIGTRLIARIAGIEAAPGRQANVGCSIGAVLSRDVVPPTVQDLVKAADLALYASKDKGRGRMTVFDPKLCVEDRAQQALDAGKVMAKPAE